MRLIAWLIGLNSIFGKDSRLLRTRAVNTNRSFKHREIIAKYGCPSDQRPTPEYIQRRRMSARSELECRVVTTC